MLPFENYCLLVEVLRTELAQCLLVSRVSINPVCVSFAKKDVKNVYEDSNSQDFG